MNSTTCIETVQAQEAHSQVLTDKVQEALAVLHARPISPLVVGQDGESESTRKTRPKTVVVITVCATGMNALLASLVIITFPTIAIDLHMSPELLLWYVILGV
jgi:hypothetical protein